MTPSEHYLAQLARGTFLSIWSYPNLHTDEGRRNAKGDGKELCDLLVVFGNNVLLFSDKHCEFPEQKDIRVAWPRWYKRAIEKSARQIFGAENWIRRFPDRIFLDKDCTKKLPIPIPDVATARFFRLAVTRGSYSKCQQFFGGQSTGSLMIDTAVRGAQHYEKPFRVGFIDPNRGFVHVLDELTLEILLREFDTISDLVTYLENKEELLSTPSCSVQATGEEQLAACYLSNLDQTRGHSFPALPADITEFIFEEGGWEEFIRHPQYLAKKQADKVSYIWDRLIEHFITNGRIHEGRFIPASPASVGDIEPALRVMASEPRFHRRYFATQLLDAMETNVKEGDRLIRLASVEEWPDTAYLFLIFPKPKYIQSYDEYREGRKAFLLVCCEAAIFHAPNSKKIVGIATEPISSTITSEDLIVYVSNGDGWTEEQLAEARELKKEFGILKEHKTTWQVAHAKEYPDLQPKRVAPSPIESISTPRGMNRAQRRAHARKGRKKGKRHSNS